MKIKQGSNVMLFLATFFVYGGFLVDALSYDHTAILDCIAEPLKPQYNGGILVNPEMNDGLNGWAAHGGVKIDHRVSKNGNNFIVALSRTSYNGSVSQKVSLEKEKLYTFSAWVQVSGRTNVPVIAIFKTNEGLRPAGSVEAQEGCWSMLKGGFTVESSTPAELIFQANDTNVDVWIDNVSLQPFTQEEWKSHQDQRIEKVRKAKVRFQVLNSEGRPASYANISIKQTATSFPIGASINNNIVNNVAYQNWFTSRFKFTTFENEMKWYSTENTPGQEDYSQADAMIDFTSQHGISVRGHNIFWDDPKYQLQWVNNLSPQDLARATDRRLTSVVQRYAGKVIAWDVNNENLHFDYFESKLGPKITDVFFQKTHQLDRQATLFMNDYNTIEEEGDTTASPSKYLDRIKEIQSSVGPSVSLGIGLEGHFGTPNIPFIRSALDTLASANVPIWITELDVQAGPNQVSYYEQLLRELHSHPTIHGMVLWGPYSPQNSCYRMCLVNSDFQNLPAGDVLDKLLGEWGGRGREPVVATTDADGFFSTSLFHGDYEVKLLQQQMHKLVEQQSSSVVTPSLRVDAHSSDQTVKIIISD